MWAYIIRCLVAFDQFANVAFLFGSPDETISARAGRLRLAHPWSWGLLARVLDWIQLDHVELAIEHDDQRAETVEKVEEAAEKEGL